MAHDSFVNGRSIIHKGSGDKAIASAPDVCKTPAGSAVVPIPYPNISQSSTLKKGSKTVKINGNSAAIEGAMFESSNGDQAGSIGGVVSGTTGKETEFVSCAFDVKFEGKGVVRHADMTMHNKKNTMGMVIGSAGAAALIKDNEREKDKCPYCKKDKHDLAKKWGSNNGNGQELRKNIIQNIEDHKWYTSPRSLQAHHLICSEAMDDDDWYRFCMDFGYDINHKKNGVMLPYFMELACQLHVPLHRSNHSSGEAEGVSYPEKIMLEMEEIANDIRSGKFCDNPSSLIDELNDYSEFVLGEISSFRWTITSDGKDYKYNGNGCAGVTSLKDKPSKSCPCNRAHGLTKQNGTNVIPRNAQSLEVGK